MKPGDIANGLKLDKGLKEVEKTYGRQGYLEARLHPAPEFDDSSRKVTYKVQINEGPQYRMGGLMFKGLTERDAKALRDGWRLKRGEIFDGSYLEEFFKRDAGSAMQRLFNERRDAGKPPPRIDSRIKTNRETLAVDVTLELTN